MDSLKEKTRKLIQRIRLRKQASELGFPYLLKKVYLYIAITTCGYFVYTEWKKHNIKENNNIDGIPLRTKGVYVGVYRCFKKYKGSYCGSDYACGDSGKYGDFILDRIDTIPSLATERENKK